MSTPARARRGVRTLLTLLLTTALGFAFAPPAQAETESNNTMATASPLTVGVTGDTAAAINPGGDVDWYRFDAPSAGTYTAEAYNVANTIDTITLYAYNSGGNQVASYSSGTGNTDTRMSINVSIPGTYYVKAASYYGAQVGTYSLRVLPQYDQGLTWNAAFEPNDTRMTSYAIGVGVAKALNATIEPRTATYSTANADTDWYRFDAPSAGTYTAEAYNVANTIDTITLYAYNSGGNEIASYSSGTGNTDTRMSINVSIPGTYYVKATPYYSDQSGTYSLRVLPQYDQGLTWNAAFEPNDTRMTSYAIGVGVAKALNATIEPRTATYSTANADTDWYRFDAPSAGTYTAEAYNVANTIDTITLYAYNSGGNQVASYSSGTGNTDTRMSINVSIPGTYYVKATPYYSDQSGTYSLRVLPQYDQGLTWDSNHEPNDTRMTSAAGQLGVNTTSTIVERNSLLSTADADVDIFRFPLSAGTTYAVELGSAPMTMYTQLEDGAGNTVAGYDYCSTGETCTLTFTPSISATYFLRNEPSSSTASGTYTFCLHDASTACTTPGQGTPGTYRSVNPSRVLDTRSGNGATGPIAGNGGTVSLQITGRGGVPASGVSAVVLNVTVTNTSAPGFITAYPAGTTMPNASNLNFTAGQTIPNLVTVKLSGDGRVSLTNNSSNSVQLVADVAGYYVAGTPSAAGTFTSLAPSRLLDSRYGNGYTGPVAGDGGTVPLQVTGRGGVPASGVSAVVLNVTVTNTKAAGFITAYPSGTTRPNASNLNFAAGDTIPNLVTVKVGADGKVNLANSSSLSVDLVADVAGYYLAGTPTAPGAFVALSPARVLDSRYANGYTGPVAGGSTVNLQLNGRGGLPSSGVGAVVLNTTVTNTKAAGFITVFPSGTAMPNASNLNFGPGQTIPNLVIVKEGSDGRVNLANNSSQSVDLVADVAGYFIG